MGDEYVKGVPYPPPYQALGPGAMCPMGLPDGCSNYRCPVDPGFMKPCPYIPAYLNESAPGPPEIPQCGIGDMVCEGYDEELIRDGWFYTLGDLNHSHPFVHDELIKWGRYMVDTYAIDAIRLDTAPYVSKEFLTDFQAAVGVPILGEVTSTNYSFFSSFSPIGGNPVLDGLLNFHVSSIATPAFCGSFFPGAVLNLSRLDSQMVQSLTGGKLSDVDLLGNFVDNHDEERLASACKGDSSRIQNALAWTMFYRGIPIVYYGTEALLTETRESFWQLGYNISSPGYRFLATMNRVRRDQDLALQGLELKFSNMSTLVFTRGGDMGTWVYVNNLAETGDDLAYCAIPAAAPEGREWRDLLTGEPATFVGGCLSVTGSNPKVLGLVLAVCDDSAARPGPLGTFSAIAAMSLATFAALWGSAC